MEAVRLQEENLEFQSGFKPPSASSTHLRNPQETAAFKMLIKLEEPF
jgi:hypothetical protein